MANPLADYLFSNEVLFHYPGVTKSTSSVLSEVKEPKPVASPPPVVTQIPAPVQAPEPVAAPPKTNLFTRSFVVFVNQINAEEKEFLGKILGSVKQSFESVLLFDVSKDGEFPSEEFFRQQQTRKVLSFGVAMSKLDNNLLLFPYQKKSHRGFDFLITDDLGTISKNLKDEKKLLWVALKEMFTL
ncbi:hypothetical protein GVN16_18925 [Emticicia sp. CRIBPO]|uniref:hypothetical protein n=1 Tax=Emticicia sp. CRIBPO TaxID=2683258 RepID=UPI0014124010|nr:hypothetical protein [Emticicia sp. CRIBPO]NBA87850.1 hypothetical protein [Emticicia sp. CRIBPO]